MQKNEISLSAMEKNHLKMGKDLHIRLKVWLY